jgi:hypothetical protein
LKAADVVFKNNSILELEELAIGDTADTKFERNKSYTSKKSEHST